MSLIGTLTSGVSAMRSFTKGLEVIGNNIANVNTIGYKGSTVSFADTFSDTLRSSAPSSNGTSNQSATQVGTGVKVASISQRFTQGALSTTGLETDLAVSGEGFFIVKNPTEGQTYATRAGNFRVDDNGYLVTTDGYRVQGLVGGTASAGPSRLGDIRLKTSGEIAAEWPMINATAIAAANLTRDETAAASTSLAALVTSTGSLPDAASVLAEMQNSVSNALYSVALAQANASGNAATVTDLTSKKTAFDTATSSLASAQTALAADPANATLQQAVADAQTALTTAQTAFETARNTLVAAADETNATVATALTQHTALKSAYTAANSAKGNGSAADQLSNVKESLADSAANAVTASTTAATAATAAATPSQRTSFSIDKGGNLIEFYGNGASVSTNRVLLQNFNDPSALEKEGNNLYSGFTAAGPTSGSSTLTGTDNTAGSNGLGKIQSGTLELANVDLTEQFANMITTQRSFQASSRLVTVSDSILEEIANLKR